MNTTVLAPVGAPDRIQLLDILRGLALLGIFLMNVEYFSRPMMEIDSGISPGLSGADWLADAFVYVFVRGKFWMLFSLLFGMGFAVMLLRAQAAGRPFTALYLRRTFGLLLIGLVHGLFLWIGDILLTYAITALLLLLFFRNTPTPRLWKWGVAMQCAVLLVIFTAAAGMAAMSPDPAGAQATVERLAAIKAKEIEAFSSGTYAEANAVRLKLFQVHLGMIWTEVLSALGLFLGGAWLVRIGAMADPAAHRRLFVRLALVGGLLGLAATAWSIAIDPDPAYDPTVPGAAAMVASGLHMLGAPLMALGYIGAVVLAWQAGARWLRVLAPAGRMALTNYLAQSAVGTLVFYGYGLGMWGEVGRAGQTLLVVSVFVLQVAASHWWLSRFRFGPVEWLWRAFTYWQRPAMRQPRAAPALA